MTVQADPDLSKVPKIDSLVDWFSKLDKWCQAAVEEIQHLRDVNGQQHSSLETFERELQQQKHDDLECESLIEGIRDYSRGIITKADLLELAGGMVDRSRPPA